MKLLDLKPEDFDASTKRIVGFRAYIFATKDYTQVRITMPTQRHTFDVAEIVKGEGQADYELVLGKIAYTEERRDV